MEIERLPQRMQMLITSNLVGTGCWLWNGGLNEDGYGTTTLNSRTMGAHRAVTLILTGSVGPELDHLCRTRNCVNPSHMESVTHRVNVLRGLGIAAKYAQRTHCKHGHEFTPENTYRKGHARICVLCKKEKNEKSYVKINGPRTGKAGGFNGRAKITDNDVQSIRQDSRRQWIIAEQYGILKRQSVQSSAANFGPTLRAK